MTMGTDLYVSIDQNSCPLWDVVPKLHALQANGWRGVHLVEDIDLAFTRHGAHPGDHDLRLLPERYYRGGATDWGAALFCFDFLGRLPLDVRVLEPYTGWSTAALSRRLGTTVAGLYDRYSASDNHQLVGPSYASGDGMHRTIGDVSTAECLGLVHDLFERSHANLLASFPHPESQERLESWFAAQRACLRSWVDAGAERLIDLHRNWVAAACSKSVIVNPTSAYVRDLCRPGAAAGELMQTFVRDYTEMVALYNAAIEESQGEMKPLHANRGELPLFAVFASNGRLFRTDLFLDAGRLRAGAMSWGLSADGGMPLTDMETDGLVCVCGKALLLVLLVRIGDAGRHLALPHQGSLYMPSAYALERNLSAEGRLPAERKTVQRVHQHFFRTWRGCRCPIVLPPHLQGPFGAAELPAESFAEHLPALQARAEDTLDACKTEEGRHALMHGICPERTAERDVLERRRRELARDPATRDQAGAIWDRVKEIDRETLSRFVDWILAQLHVVDLSYYDSRGALLPWSIALGGESLYQELVSQASIETESSTP